MKTPVWMRRVGFGCLFLLALFALVVLVPLVLPSPRHVLRRSAADPRVKAAIAQTQKTLDRFIAKLNQPKAGERFAIMVGLPTDSGPEYLWCKDPTYANGVFTATLDQRPMVAKSQVGDSITVKRADVVDWLIRETDGKTEGQFTEQIGQPASPSGAK